MSRYSYQLFVFNLAAAGSERIDIEGGHLYIKEATDSTVNIDVQVDDNTADKVNLVRKTGIIGKFKTLFVSWAAQPGKTLTLLVSSSYDDFRVNEQALTDVNIASSVSLLVSGAGFYLASDATTATVYNVTCVVLNTEYNQSLGSVRKFMVRARGGDLKLCFTGGQSGTNYLTIPNGACLAIDGIINVTDLYFQSPVSGTVAEILKYF